MLIGRVVGTVVATKKNLKLDGEKLLLVQPLELSGAAKGVPIIAIDRMGAGDGVFRDHGHRKTAGHQNSPRPHGGLSRSERPAQDS